MADKPTQETVSEETEIPEPQESTEGQSETTDEAQDESESSNTEGNSPAADDQWVVPGQYRTVDDLKNAVRYFQSENSRRANELHRLKTERTGPPADRKAVNEEWAKAVERDPEGAVRNLVRSETEEAKQETRKVRFDTEYARLWGDGKTEFAQLEPVMTQIANQYNDFLDDKARSDPRLLHILFFAAKGLQTDQRVRQAESTGKLKGQKVALRKSKAQVEGASGTKGHVKRDPEKMSLAELKAHIEKGHLTD